MTEKILHEPSLWRVEWETKTKEYHLSTLGEREQPQHSKEEQWVTIGVFDTFKEAKAAADRKVESHNAIERWRVEYSWKQKQYHLSPAECWDNNPAWETLGVFDTLTAAQAKIRELRSINYGNEYE